MKNYIVFSLLLTLIACSSNRNKNDSAEDASSVRMEFDQVLNDYFIEGLDLNPLMATEFGIDGYNHSIPNFLADEYIEQAKMNYDKYI